MVETVFPVTAPRLDASVIPEASPAALIALAAAGVSLAPAASATAAQLQSLGDKLGVAASEGRLGKLAATVTPAPDYRFSYSVDPDPPPRNRAERRDLKHNRGRYRLR